MKYAQYLHALERDAPKQWRGKFLKYKEHKKQIKAYKDDLVAIEQAGGKAGDSTAHNTRLANAFFNKLLVDVIDVNWEFERAARALLRLQHQRRGPPGCMGRLALGLRRAARLEGPSLKVSTKDMGLEQQAGWCRRFAQVNAVGLRKILKKHDKLCASKHGQDFLQSLWNGMRRAHGSFLHSPLLDELKAMEAILARDNAAAAQAALVAAAAGAVHPAFGDPLPDDPVPTAGEREPGEGAGGGAGAGRGAAEGMAGSAGARLDARMTLPLLASLAEEAPAVVIEEGSGSGAGGTPSPGAPQDATGGAASPGTPPAAPPLQCAPSRPIPIARSSGRGVGPPTWRASPARGASPGSAAAAAAAEPGCGGSFGPEAEVTSVSIASSGLGPAEEVDEDYLCPICLDVMYKAIGLECGHKFCADCAFTAVGKGNALGTVRAILFHVRHDAACPECRTPGVFVLAHELHQTDQLVRRRWPEEHAKRAKEMQAKEARLRAILAQQRAERVQENSFRPSF